MAGAAVKHDYHLVEPSPWPFVGSLGAFVLAVGAVVFMAGLATDPLTLIVPPLTPEAAELARAAGAQAVRDALAASPDFQGDVDAVLADYNRANVWWGFLGKGSPWIMLLGLGLVIWTMIAWWGDMVKEARLGRHTPVVQLGLRYGMILFIASEVMFFVAWFWIFFEGALYHDVRVAEGWIAQYGLIDDAGVWSDWPVVGTEVLDPYHLPLLNTLILLTSGTTVTWAHHAHQHGKMGEAKLGLLLTVVLGALFTAVQAYEYTHAQFAFGGEGADLYGAAFFMATGFHGFHVIVGTIFLAVCLFLLMRGDLPRERPFALDAAAWYWHFVDVVWLFLFAFVYVVPAVGRAGAG